jgi:hypothetical protein
LASNSSSGCGFSIGGRTPIALDGTEYSCLQKLGCPHRLTRKRSNAKVESYHFMLAATTYDGAFVASLDVSRETVAKIVACARARWKIENESFNVLKNNGYHLEHNFGHGEQNLVVLFAAMNLLAFAIHTVRDGLEDLLIKAPDAKRARKRFFEHVRTITAHLVFRDWETLMITLINSKPPPEIEKTDRHLKSRRESDLESLAYRRKTCV